ncbi:MAG TPA: hypothetical protein VFE60_19010 [Roseiarcus sp.]|nr:hypothetical protein [Roseiarcus sp.]
MGRVRHAVESACGLQRLLRGRSRGIDQQLTCGRRQTALAHESLLAGQISADYIRAAPAINLTDDELAAVTATIRRVIEADRFPHAPRLDPLRVALAKLDAEAAPEPSPHPKAHPPGKADKWARR